MNNNTNFIKIININNNINNKINKQNYKIEIKIKNQDQIKKNNFTLNF